LEATTLSAPSLTAEFEGIETTGTIVTPERADGPDRTGDSTRAERERGGIALTPEFTPRFEPTAPEAPETEDAPLTDPVMVSAAAW
jgi:hypothetical protein